MSFSQFILSFSQAHTSRHTMLPCSAALQQRLNASEHSQQSSIRPKASPNPQRIYKIWNLWNKHKCCFRCKVGPPIDLFIDRANWTLPWLKKNVTLFVLLFLSRLLYRPFWYRRVCCGGKWLNLLPDAVNVKMFYFSSSFLFNNILF